MNILEMKRWKSMVEVTLIERLRNKVVRKKPGIEIVGSVSECRDGLDTWSLMDEYGMTTRVSRWFRHVEFNGLVRYGQKGVEGRSKWSASARQTRD